MFLEDASEIRGVVRLAPLEVIRIAKTPSRSTVPSSEEPSDTVSKLVLEICEAKRFEDETRVSITEWRQPSRKVYEKRKPNTNSRIK